MIQLDTYFSSGWKPSTKIEFWQPLSFEISLHSLPRPIFELCFLVSHRWNMIKHITYVYNTHGIETLPFANAQPNILSLKVMWRNVPTCFFNDDFPVYRASQKNLQSSPTGTEEWASKNRWSPWVVATHRCALLSRREQVSTCIL